MNFDYITEKSHLLAALGAVRFFFYTGSPKSKHGGCREIIRASEGGQLFDARGRLKLHQRILSFSCDKKQGLDTQASFARSTLLNIFISRSAKSMTSIHRVFHEIQVKS